MFFDDFFNLFVGGSQALLDNGKIVLLIAVQILGVGSLGYFHLFRKAPELRSLKGESILTLGISLNVIFAFGGVWLSTLWAGALVLTAKGLFFLSLLGVFLLLVNGLKEYKKKQISSSHFIFLILVFFFLLVRFAFIARLEYPLYHDSAVHYQIITDFLQTTQPALAVYRIENLVFNRYYHFGYHSLITVFSVLFNGTVSTAKLMLVSGQVLLIFLPISLGILAKELHGESKAGWYVAVLAGVGWSLPAYAVNWGKYPVLSSLIVLPLVLYWCMKLRHIRDNTQRIYLILFLVSMAAMILLHSRTFLLAFLTLFVFYLVEKLLNRFFNKNLDYWLVANVFVIWTVAVLNSYFRKALLLYFENFNLVITLAFIFLALYLSHNRVYITVAMTLVAVIALASSVRIPEPLSKYAGFYFFDYPFLAIILFEPLAVVGGVGLYELLKDFSKRFSLHHYFTEISLLLLVLGLFFFRPVSDYLPGDCCNYMREDDIFTIGWMANTLPDESTIFIAAQNEFPSNDPSDAGAWVFSLTGLKTEKLNWDSDFSDEAVYADLCIQQPGYIYASAVNASFSIMVLEENPEKFTLALAFPETRLYQINCK